MGGSERTSCKRDSNKKAQPQSQPPKEKINNRSHWNFFDVSTLKLFFLNMLLTSYAFNLLIQFSNVNNYCESSVKFEENEAKKTSSSNPHIEGQYNPP